MSSSDTSLLNYFLELKYFFFFINFGKEMRKNIDDEDFDKNIWYIS